MSNKSSKEELHSFGFTPREKQISVLPTGIASIVVLIFMMFNGILSPSGNPIQDVWLILYCIANSLYLGYFHFIQIPSPNLKDGHIWTYAVLQVIASALVLLILPARMDIFLSGLMILLCITASIIADRILATFIMVGISGANFFLNLEAMRIPTELMRLLGTTLIAGVINEAIFQLKNLTYRNINQLKIINDFSRQITASLETNQVIAMLNDAIPKTLQADSYSFGLVEGDRLNLSLLYDDGEYFNNVSMKLSGSLSGWVIKNNKGLFLPDLRRDLDLAGVEKIIVGQDKTSLSWMGVPISGLHVHGIIALASYLPNAFNRSDLELMNNIAQQAALALDNTFHHAQVEEQSRLDSLTGVYNHGYFLSLLKKYTEELRASRTPLSLIMLDVDYFKQYNDTYGHLAGDEILSALCRNIQKHIKQSDFVGRWGGEEFAISLPNANGKQAQKIAQRIHENMAALKIQGLSQKDIPAPTISLGIAQFPNEADEIMKLVDLADRRLYIAKHRGRNQIEPAAEHWDKMLP